MDVNLGLLWKDKVTHGNIQMSAIYRTKNSAIYHVK